MLRQIIYASTANLNDRNLDLQTLEAECCARNAQTSISGLLAFDGSFFFQIIEGPNEKVQSLFDAIQMDRRHQDIILLQDSIINQRDVSTWPMKLFLFDTDNQDTPYWLPPDIKIARDSRAFQFLHQFATGKWHSNTLNPSKAPPPFALSDEKILVPQFDFDVQFAYQPIVDMTTCEVTSIEALIRGKSGESPDQLFNELKNDNIYHFDLKTKSIAIRMGSALLEPGASLSINLLPGALTHHKDAASFLEAEVKSCGLQAHQLIIEITETEAISNRKEFDRAVERLKASGFQLALDDFGSGYAGLSMITRFMPDKIKLDRALICGIHQDGTRQAIVRSLVELSRSLAIPLVAEGVESCDEWVWLEKAGIQRFQGFLFGRPLLNGVPVIHWKELVERYNQRLKRAEPHPPKPIRRR